MACDMIESCIQRTDSSYQQWIKKGVTFVSTDYNIPAEMCAMINVILDAKNQAFKLCAVDGIDVVRVLSIFHRSHCPRAELLFLFLEPSQHQYHTKIDDLIDKASYSMTQALLSKLMSVLESSLSKLSRYDEGSLIGSLLSFTVSRSMQSMSVTLFRKRDFMVLILISTERFWLWARAGSSLRQLHKELHGSNKDKSER
jgi:hypothetical protein